MISPSMRRAVITLCITASALALSVEASAQPRDVHLAMQRSLWWDVGYIAVAGAMGVSSLALEPPVVDRAPFDGLGGRAWNADVGLASDVVLWGGMAATIGLGVVVERFGRDARDVRLLRASLVMGESVAMTLGVVGLVKNVAGECRPRAWNDAAARCDAAVIDDRRAFPSGHTSPLAAMAGAAVGMMAFPTGGQQAYWPLVVTASTLAATNLVLRVVAGAHSWVDTSTGFAFGFGVGLATAALHTYSGPARVSFGANAQGVTVSGQF